MKKNKDLTKKDFYRAKAWLSRKLTKYEIEREEYIEKYIIDSLKKDL